MKEGASFFLFAFVIYLNGGDTVTGKPEKLKNVGSCVSLRAHTRAVTLSACRL